MTFIQEEPGLAEDGHLVWNESELPRTRATPLPVNSLRNRWPDDDMGRQRPETSHSDADGLLAHSEHSAWPLKNLSEAELLRHFIQKLAIWVTKSPDRLGGFTRLIAVDLGSSISVTRHGTSRPLFLNGQEQVQYC